MIKDRRTITITFGKLLPGPLNGVYQFVTSKGHLYHGEFSDGCLTANFLKVKNGKIRQGLLDICPPTIDDSRDEYRPEHKKHNFGGFGYSREIFRQINLTYTAISQKPIQKENHFSAKFPAEAVISALEWAGPHPDSPAANRHQSMFQTFTTLSPNRVSNFFNFFNKLFNIDDEQIPNLKMTPELRKGHGFGAIYLSDYQFAIGTFQDFVLVSGKVLDNFRLLTGNFKDGRLHGDGKIEYMGAKKINNKVTVDIPEELGFLIEEIKECRDLRLAYDQLTFRDCKSYKLGTFQNGRLHGYGRVSLLGMMLVGDFANGVLNGQGNRTFYDGQVEEGFFKNGALIQTKVDKVVNVEWLGMGVLQEGVSHNGRLTGSLVVQPLDPIQVRIDYQNGCTSGKFVLKNHKFTICGWAVRGKLERLDQISERSGNPLIGTLVNRKNYDKLSKVHVNQQACVWTGNLENMHMTGTGQFTDPFGNNVELNFNFLRGPNFMLATSLPFIFKVCRHMIQKAEFVDGTKIVNIPQVVGDLGTFGQDNERVLWRSNYLKHTENVTIVTARSIYIGGYLNGLPHGSAYFQHDMTLWRGAMNLGQMNGSGLQFDLFGRINSGKFENNNNWEGLQITGMVFRRGQFRFGKMEGSCEVRTPESMITAIFRNNQIETIEQILDDFRRPINFPLWGSKNDLGYGKCVKPDGTIIEGSYRSGDDGQTCLEADSFGLKHLLVWQRNNLTVKNVKIDEKIFESWNPSFVLKPFSPENPETDLPLEERIKRALAPHNQYISIARTWNDGKSEDFTRF